MDHSEKHPLEGKVAVVTGSSRGIGRAVAETLASLGADIVVTARTVTPRADLAGTIDETANAVRALGRRSLAVPADLTSDEDIATLVEGAIREFGQVDILVNNAAATDLRMYDSLWDMTPESWRYQIALNLTSPWLVTKAFASHMRERGGGVIINITSALAGLPPNPHLPGKGSSGAAYPASKVALSRLTADLAKELRPFGIAILALHPGFVRTENSEISAPMAGFDISYAQDTAVPTSALSYLLASADLMEMTGTVVFAPTLVTEHSLL